MVDTERAEHKVRHDKSYRTEPRSSSANASLFVSAPRDTLRVTSRRTVSGTVTEYVELFIIIISHETSNVTLGIISEMWKD